MIKKDVIRQIHQAHGGLSLKEIERHTQSLLALLERVIDAEPLTISGFGRFQHKKRSVREIKMPDGRRALTDSTQKVQFLPSPALKTYLNNDDELL